MSSFSFSNKNKNFKILYKGILLKKIISLCLISLILFSFIFISTDYNKKNELSLRDNSNENLQEVKTPSSSISLDTLKDPFTENISKMQIFFENNFKSDYDASIYVSESNNLSVITDDTVYSLDNLRIYKSLFQDKYNYSETYNAYMALKDTKLWYEGNGLKYGFIESLNGSDGSIINSNRSLIDNLMPIFLLLENIGYDLEKISGAVGEIVDVFELINSTEFYNLTDGGFYEFNQTNTVDTYYTESNLYSVLAMFMIHEFKDDINNLVGNTKMTDRAYYLANNTMKILLNEMWDATDLGFFYRAGANWNTGIPFPGNSYKYLNVNALGIIALLETWKKNGMRTNGSNSDFLNKSIALYEKISGPRSPFGLWNENQKLYEYFATEDWTDYGDSSDDKLDLEANALMMLACLKLFEATGNFTYYERAFTLFESIRDKFYYSSIDAHKTSIGGIATNYNVNLHSNLVICEAYRFAEEIFRSVFLVASYNVSGKEDYIMNQDSLNITCIYTFNRDVLYYDTYLATPKYNTNTTKYENITGATVTFRFFYPNGSFIEDIEESTINSTVNRIYNINNSLNIVDGYKIVIFANSTYFGFANTTKFFNVKSGFTDFVVTGIEDDLYQSQSINITVNITSIYNFNITINVTIYGDNIEEYTTPQPILFLNNSVTSVILNLTVDIAAIEGLSKIYFTFYNGTILYLEEYDEIFIINALFYSNLIHNEYIVPGQYLRVSLDLINYLTNTSQNLNISFSGRYINDSGKIAVTLEKNERRRATYSLSTINTINVDRISISMLITKKNMTIYELDFYVDIVAKFELISIKYPGKVSQGVSTYLIIIIQNNLEFNEEFSLELDDKSVALELEELKPGENRIEYKFISTWNPYEFGVKSIDVNIKDGSDNIIIEESFEYEIQLSSISLLCYIIPIAIPIGIILYFKNKDIKNKLLRR